MKTNKGKNSQDVTFQAADGTTVYGCIRRPHGNGPFPAVIFIHGEEDDEVPVAHAYKLAESLKRSKHEYELKIFKNEGHGIRDPQARREMDQMVLGFLKKQLE